MGNGIISRTNNGPKFKVGDIRLTTLDSINNKWALCNGDPVTMEGGISPELGNFLSGDPTNSESWNPIECDVLFKDFFYNKSDGFYYGVNIIQYGSNQAISGSYQTINIYKMTQSGSSLVFTKKYNAGDNTKLAEIGHAGAYIVDVIYSEYLDKILIISKYSTTTVYFSSIDISSGTVSFLYNITNANGAIGNIDGTPYIITGTGKTPTVWAIGNYISWLAGYSNSGITIAMHDLSTKSTFGLGISSSIFTCNGSDTSDFFYTKIDCIRIAMAESKDYICYTITQEIGCQRDDYGDGSAFSSFEMYDGGVVCIKKSANYTSSDFASYHPIKSVNSNSDYRNRVDSPSMTCYDYDNNKFTFSMVYRDALEVYRIAYMFDPSQSLQIFPYNTEIYIGELDVKAYNYGLYCNIINIDNKLYSIISDYEENCYISNIGLDSSDDSIKQLIGMTWGSNTTILNNAIPMKLEFYKGHIPMDRKVIMYASSAIDNHYYDFNGLSAYAFRGGDSLTLPTIDEEGYNAFIKIKD